MPPTAERGGCRPDAVGTSASGVVPLARHPGRRRRPAGRRDRPAGIRRLDLSRYEKRPAKGGAKRLRKVIAFRQNYPGQRIASCAHSVARRSFLLKRRQASQQALLQRAARPNFFSSRRNTLSQTLPAFGARCQPRRCLRSSRWTSVVSSYRSNPTHRVSPSPVQPARCQPLRSRERFPI